MTGVSAPGKAEMYKTQNSALERERKIDAKVLIDATGLRQLGHTVGIRGRREGFEAVKRRDSFLGAPMTCKSLHATLLIL